MQITKKGVGLDMKKTCSDGFTLIELLITIAIAAILLTLAAPSFTTMIKNNRLAVQTNDLITDLALARGEAAKRGVRVTMCISSDGATCTGSNWALGRLIYTDGGTAGTVDGTDEILRVTSVLQGTSVLTSAGFANAGYMQYLPLGATDSAGTFKLCDDRTGNFGRLITIAVTGRAITSFNQACP